MLLTIWDIKDLRDAFYSGLDRVNQILLYSNIIEQKTNTRRVKVDLRQPTP